MFRCSAAGECAADKGENFCVCTCFDLSRLNFLVTHSDCLCSGRRDVFFFFLQQSLGWLGPITHFRCPSFLFLVLVGWFIHMHATC
ncbi:uncharacterized protein TEOVI_000589100 [Trypanosoma equiperdum]|uniref:Uncharacterized protein n=2 Tax=Trypanozoon TaxID=39700 RepID=Q4GYI5_TRYB2|nr:hypothetical protein, unlikely [Trypanosoma brucei brucei TREU927]CAJ16599.1 hypothetical protein, unlikely [Trypanosoma brucei brucei TREU927]SCU64455.1 hypothetical protein, conserved [Trypanosoma equiperdum]